MEFPQVDLPVDMIAWTEVTEDILNIYKQSCVNFQNWRID